MKRLYMIFPCLLLVIAPPVARGDIARGDDPAQIDLFTDIDEWLDAVPEVVIIDFTDIAPGEQIDDQYLDLGVAFTSGFYTGFQNDGAFIDSHGVDGNSTTIVIDFAQPFSVFGVLFPGNAMMTFFLDDELVGWTANAGIGVPAFFAGVIADVVFDEVHVIDSADEVAIDNIYFSFIEVPAPGAALPLLGCGVFARSRSRRRTRRD